MSSDEPSLVELAQVFADDLTTTVQTVVPGSVPFTAKVVPERSVVSVKQEPGDGIVLTVDGKPHLLLKVSFRCSFDGHSRFLAVDSSRVHVFASVSPGQPLFRYEYERRASQVPAAHIQIHAHRDALTYVMTKSGAGARRGRRRSDSEQVPLMQDLHFPVGGHRFRPALEDVLEMLIDEFGIDDAKDAREALHVGRQAWRQTQTKSAVRDDPQSAVEVLRQLGYEVDWRGGGEEPQSRLDRLQAL
ncbi:hypothetical protein LG293_01995 [Citricoccus nitrophenolicus]